VNSETAKKIVNYAVDKLQSMGYNKASFRIDRIEEGVFGNTPWRDFTIVENESKKPVVFSFLVEDSQDDESEGGLILSVLDSGDIDGSSYAMDTKDFKSCKDTDEVVEAFVAWYERERAEDEE